MDRRAQATARSALPSVSRTTANDPVQRTFGTLPEANRRFGIGLKKLRQRAAEGAFPVYSGETAWPRVKFAEVEEWLRSTRVPVTDHARSRVDEILARETNRGGVENEQRRAKGPA